MHSTQRNREQQKLRSEAHSFVIQIRGTISDTHQELEEPLHQTTQQHTPTTIPSNNIIKFNFSAMKLFHRFRKVLMRLMFSVPSRASNGRSSSSKDNSRQRNSHHHHHERSFEPPKTSCSSYYSSYSHYNEAIADCIEFFNKSSSSAQDDYGFSDGPRNSDVV